MQRRRDGLLECFAYGRLRTFPRSLLVTDRGSQPPTPKQQPELALFERMRGHCFERYGSDVALREMFEQWHRLLCRSDRAAP